MNIDEIEALLFSISPSPWSVDAGGRLCDVNDEKLVYGDHYGDGGFGNVMDEKFVAAAPTLVRQLLDMIAELQEDSCCGHRRCPGGSLCCCPLDPVVYN